LKIYFGNCLERFGIFQGVKVEVLSSRKEAHALVSDVFNDVLHYEMPNAWNKIGPNLYIKTSW
jgi:hypothetical protein